MSTKKNSQTNFGIVITFVELGVLCQHNKTSERVNLSE